MRDVEGKETGQEEEAGFSMPRRKLSKNLLSGVVVEDDEQLVNKIRNVFPDYDAAIWIRKEEVEEAVDPNLIDRAKYKEYKKSQPPPPPLYSDEVGEVDVSTACVIQVDGLQLKSYSTLLYNCIMDFALNCLHKCCLRLFDHPGDPIGGRLSGVDDIYCNAVEYREIALAAIDQYNIISKNVELELVNIVKINRRGCCHFIHYMTFSAIDKKAGQIGLYQAAVADYVEDEYLLGLLRDHANDRVLAILSLTGVEGEVAARRKLRCFKTADGKHGKSEFSQNK